MMKRIFLALLFITAVFTSCKKLQGVQPGENNTTTTTTTTNTSDTSMYQIIYSAAAQQVVTSISGDSLKMLYNENVNLMLPAKGYTLSYAVHMVENFSSTSLNGDNYVTYDQYGDRNYDFVDDNLNDIKSKTVTDTTVNGQALVKIHIQRPFYFFKIYTDAASAADAQNALIGKTGDMMQFSSYVYFVNVNYTTYTASFPMVYTQQ